MRRLVGLLFAAVPVWACSCAFPIGGNPPCQSAWQHSAVFTGTVIEITPPDLPRGASPSSGNQASIAPPSLPVFSQRKIRFRVAEAFLGLEPGAREVVIATGFGGGDCGYSFQVGFDYIVYADQRAEALTTSICSPTRLVADAADDIRYLRQIEQLPDTAEVRVTALDVHGEWQYTPGRPPIAPGLQGARVTIRGPAGAQSAVTDSSGRAVFPGVPPGSYSVAGSLVGFAALESGRPVQAHAKGCVEAALAMRLNRSVSGQVLGADGQPASGITVEAVPMHPQHPGDLPNPVDSATTGADGRYELHELAGGEYYVGILLGPQYGPKPLPYPRWFYPGTEDPARAGIVHVSDKPESLRLDLTLPAPMRERIIRGRVVWPDGRPGARVGILLIDERWPWMSLPPVASADAEGRFEAPAFDRARYRLQAVAVETGPAFAEPVAIEPGSEPLDLKIVLTRKGFVPFERDPARRDWRLALSPR